MAPKQKKVSNPTQSQKKMGKAKNKRWAHPPPDLPTSDMGGWITHKDIEPSLRDVMTILGSINTWLTAAKEKVHLVSHSAATVSTEGVQPSSPAEGGPPRPSAMTKIHYWGWKSRSRLG